MKIYRKYVSNVQKSLPHKVSVNWKIAQHGKQQATNVVIGISERQRTTYTHAYTHTNTNKSHTNDTIRYKIGNLRVQRFRYENQPEFLCSMI